MRACEPFLQDDLAALDGLLARAAEVVAMEDIFDGDKRPDVIAVRHDCDNVIEPALSIAAWESDRGYRSTYYALHTAPYWQDKTLLRGSLEQIAVYGHEIGIHNDALTVAIETGRDPADVLFEATEELRSYGHEIRSTVAHGNFLCGVHNYVNDEMFTECVRPDYGDISRLGFGSSSLAEFGLDFDANWLTRGDYLSDSGGRWSQPFQAVASAFPARGQLHLLQHPDWWTQAFDRAKVAA